MNSAAAATTRPLSIAVMGAGSVGCYFGALLAQAGHAVTLIGRVVHMQAINEHGLRLETATQDVYVPVATSTSADAVSGADVVLLCVKSTDTETAAAQIKPHLGAHTHVLSLQNGVDNDQRLRQVLNTQLGSQPIAAAVVYVATAMAGLGHVRHFGRGELVIAPCPLGNVIAQQFSAANIPTQVSDAVQAALWQKLIINCVYNALSALTQQPYGWLVAQEGVPAVMQDIAHECKAVALADGVQLPANVDEAVATIARTMPLQLSSTAQDLARAKPTEIDHLNGYVVRRGQALGIATPANRLLQVLVQLKQTAAKAE
ncbi:ketopantoate reductase family protein [Comamonas sp. Y33R10-2]|uniref:ketopantoate reductase family protein n=1 Tax=Comamonas sp. Y33R10-2 TaxID=2853257 RepID=UPI001C5CB4F5|nr:ketopantoate reductase family protein [Comamonas sp. Y33R10-2]QXZ09707.1 ketopantoate reductase family protein [Comamonas sp. Y33R10-2]